MACPGQSSADSWKTASRCCQLYPLTSAKTTCCRWNQPCFLWPSISWPWASSRLTFSSCQFFVRSFCFVNKNCTFLTYPSTNATYFYSARQMSHSRKTLCQHATVLFTARPWSSNYIAKSICVLQLKDIGLLPFVIKFIIFYTNEHTNAYFVQENQLHFTWFIVCKVSHGISTHLTVKQVTCFDVSRTI